ncbi:hypothetical protein [Streptococcus dentiloxodontae]
MLNWILAIIFTVVFMTIVAKIILYFRKKMLPTYKIEGDVYNNYFIGFSGVDVPNLRQNGAIMAELILKYETPNGFVVSSKLSDGKLKNLLMSQYQLNTNQVQVTHGYLFV